jgi:hypothetical protein
LAPESRRLKATLVKPRAHCFHFCAEVTSVGDADTHLKHSTAKPPWNKVLRQRNAFMSWSFTGIERAQPMLVEAAMKRAHARARPF